MNQTLPLLLGGIAPLLLGVRRPLCRFSLVLFLGKHPRQGRSRRAVAALSGEAEESGPDEGAAAGEGGPHVQRHQGEVQKLRGAEGAEEQVSAQTRLQGS